MAVAYGDQKDTSPVRIKCRCLQVELEPVQIFVSQSPKIDTPGLHEVLFDRANLVVRIRDIVEAIHAASQAARCTQEQRPLEESSISRGQEVAIGSRRAIQEVIAHL